MSGPFKMKGWSPFTRTEEEHEKTLKKLEKEHDVAAHVEEGTTESQLLILKTRCKKKGGTWNDDTQSCE